MKTINATGIAAREHDVTADGVSKTDCYTM